MISTSLSAQLAERQTRLRLGLWLGLVAGVVYGALSVSINQLLLWGVPLRGGVGAMLVSALLSGAGLAAVGYFTAWAESSFKGLLAGAVFIVAYGVVNAYVHQPGGSGALVGTTIVLLVTSLPSVVFSFLITAPLRLAINSYREALQHSGRPRVFRVGRVWLAVLALALLVGNASQWPADARRAVRTVHGLIQTALTTGAAPPALRTIPDFMGRASAHYTLDQHSDVSADTSIAGSVAQETIIVDVLFDTGLRIECLMNKNSTQPFCSEVRE